MTCVNSDVFAFVSNPSIMLYESSVLPKVLSYRNVFITYIDSACVVMSYIIHITC